MSVFAKLSIVVGAVAVGGIAGMLALIGWPARRAERADQKSEAL